MRNHYEVLGIPRDASDGLVKLAWEGKMKALADPGYSASASEKREEERLLRLAYATLSVHRLRAAYDDKLDAAEIAELEAPVGLAAWVPRSRIALFALALAVLAGGGLFYERYQVREREALARAEKARQAAQEAKWRERAEQAEARREEQRLAEEAGMVAGRQWQERNDLERERAAYDAQRRAQEAQANWAEMSARDRENLARAAREQAELQARRAEEERRREAQLEVERQKAYLKGLELDEERARLLRHEQAQREAREREYRRQLEERQSQDR